MTALPDRPDPPTSPADPTVTSTVTTWATRVPSVAPADTLPDPRLVPRRDAAPPRLPSCHGPIAPPRPLTGEEVLPVRRYYLGLGAVCLGGVAIVHLLGRTGTPVGWATGALIVQGLLAFGCAVVARERHGVALGVARAAAVVILGVAAAVPGYFFGAHSGFAALVLLATLLAGLLAGRADTGGVLPGALLATLVYLGLAAGQLALFTLVMTGVLPDTSLTPLIVPGHPGWHHVVYHLALQGLYLGALLVGLALQRRYQRLAADREATERAASLRQALIAEACQEYRRVVAMGRTTAHQPALVEARTLPAIPRRSLSPTSHGEGALTPPTTVTLPDALAVHAEATRAQGWEDAYQTKLRGFSLGMMGLCLFGLVFLAVFGRAGAPRDLGLVATGVGLVVIWAHRAVARRPDGAFHWPLALASVLLVGPAYALGIHSGFAGVIALVLFVGGAFRSVQRPRWYDRNACMYLVIASAYALMFVLVQAGLLPDRGDVLVIAPRAPSFEPVVTHLLLQGIFLGAFAGGEAIDRRYRAVLEELEMAAREAARQESVLASARADLDRALAHDGSGLFTGQRVGRYRLGRLLGRGGMGEVYQATEEGKDRLVALKLIRPDCLDPNNLRLFEMEAAALARVRSPYVAKVLEAGGADHELPYLVMEYIEGRSLGAILREQGRLPLSALCDLVHDVSLGLSHAHEAAVLHSDVKPHNIMLTRGGAGQRWKLVDFGVARLQAADVGPAAVVAGTPQYMSPEQARGDRIDTRSDIYGLSLVIYRALTGRPTFTAAHERASGPPDPAYYVEASEDLALVLRIGLASCAEDRFTSMRRLGEAFAAAVEGRLDDETRERGRELLSREPWTDPR